MTVDGIGIGDVGGAPLGTVRDSSRRLCAMQREHVESQAEGHPREPGAVLRIRLPT